MKNAILKITSVVVLGATIFTGNIALNNDTINIVTAKSYSSPKPNSWVGFKSVKLKKDIYVYKMKKGPYHAADYSLKKIKVKKNSIIKIEGWCMSCGGSYYVKTPKFKWSKTVYYQTFSRENEKFWY